MIRAKHSERRSDRAVEPLLLAVGALLAAPPAAWSAPKTDVVEMLNGDRITCEIKTLEHNQLKVSTYHMGTIYIEWDKVARVRSAQDLLVELTDGVRFHGNSSRGLRRGRCSWIAAVAVEPNRWTRPPW